MVYEWVEEGGSGLGSWFALDLGGKFDFRSFLVRAGGSGFGIRFVSLMVNCAISRMNSSLYNFIT